MASSSPQLKEPSSAVKRASTGPTALPERNKRKTSPSLPEASGATQQPAKRKPPLFQRAWSPGDEVRILEALATYRREHGGRLPTPVELFGALDGSLEKEGVGAKELAIKQRSLKRRYDRDVMKNAPPADKHERRLYLLSKHVWGRVPPTRPPVAKVRSATQAKCAGAQASNAAAQAQAKSADRQSGKEALKPKAKTLDEMRELYPYLVDEATILVEPAVLERVLLNIEDIDAQVLDKKIRKARKQLAGAITESARINNMEMPTIFLFTSSKLQPEKLRVENDNNLLVDHLEKMDDVDICAKQRLARVEHEVMELRQTVIAYQAQAKGIICESAKSGLQSIVAENQTPANVLQKKTEVPNGLIHKKNAAVTSKYYCAVPHNVPPNKPKMQGVMLPPFKVFPGMPRKIDKSPTPSKAHDDI
ncbi:uncharacterized protein [Zea mays]|uniref:Glabrous enhancer-binding protein-like DBD domain-containing protein n=1 Tax=Zea mays TaxID=4577 RepID=A0A804PRV5_MAIZE|nr:uncharacterized protein LOC103629130 isoform X2 [Zea mays]|eukprot:XP_008648544.2 uncharacterized protein LOC103629130 isoform X2 [Zea mays]